MPREPIFMECTTCGMRYYRTTKNMRKQGGQGKLELRKYCRTCRAHTAHKEKKK